MLGLSPDDGDDDGYADSGEAMVGGEIVDGGGGISYPVRQTEEDVGARLDWAGCRIDGYYRVITLFSPW